jgi:hypothetical protein
MEFRETIFENNPECNSIEFNGNWTNMEVSSVDIDGDVAIEISNDCDSDIHIFLTQENIKQLINHLQKQLK